MTERGLAKRSTAFQYLVAEGIGAIAAASVAIWALIDYGEGRLYPAVSMIYLVIAVPVGVGCGAIALATGNRVYAIAGRRRQSKYLPAVAAGAAVAVTGAIVVLIAALVAGPVSALVPAIVATAGGALLLWFHLRPQERRAKRVDED